MATWLEGGAGIFVFVGAVFIINLLVCFRMFVLYICGSMCARRLALVCGYLYVHKFEDFKTGEHSS